MCVSLCMFCYYVFNKNYRGYCKPFWFELMVAAPKDIPWSRCGPFEEKVGHPWFMRSGSLAVNVSQSVFDAPPIYTHRITKKLSCSLVSTIRDLCRRHLVTRTVFSAQSDCLVLP